MQLSAWVANVIAPASTHTLYIALRYNKPNKLKVSYLLCFFNKTRALVLSLRFRYFELRNIYNEFQIA